MFTPEVGEGLREQARQMFGEERSRQRMACTSKPLCAWCV